MVHPLVGFHVGLGELGIAAFLWVFIEMLNPTKERVRRAKIVSMLGFLFILFSWLVGGYYYIDYYGGNVKPIIKAGPQPWAHGIFMETKEHIFLFLPFLSFLEFALLKRYEKEILKNKRIKKSALLLSGTILLIGGLIAVMGYLVSAGMRTALEVGT